MTVAAHTQPTGNAGKLRVGVAGVGYLGRFHARIYAAMPDVELVGVADSNERVAKEGAEQHGCRAYTDARELLGNVDAVSIVVPTIYHSDVARPFLEKGVHMLMEKPIAPSYEESRALVELAERAGVIFQVGHLERFNAGIMALAERAQNPRFIEVHRLGPFVERATDVDVETANARIEFENGAVANVTASRVSNKKLRRIRIFGAEHYYGLDYIDQKLEMVRSEPDPDGGKWPRIAPERLDITPRPPLDAELEYFVKSVRTGTPPLVTGRVGLEALRVALLVKEKIAACTP